MSWQGNTLGVETVRMMCETLGYGFVIRQAQKYWAKKDPVGAFAIGPCLAFVEECAHGGKAAHQCDRCHGCGWVMKKAKRVEVRG